MKKQQLTQATDHRQVWARVALACGQKALRGVVNLSLHYGVTLASWPAPVCAIDVRQRWRGWGTGDRSGAAPRPGRHRASLLTSGLKQLAHTHAGCAGLGAGAWSNANLLLGSLLLLLLARIGGLW